MNCENICTWCWLIPIIVGLISAILGYLLGRLFGKGSDNGEDISVWKNKVTSLEAELAACKKSKSSGSSTASSFAAAAAIPFDANAAKAVFGKRIKENDLKIVEGIGPKIEQLFHNFDVKTWKALSQCSIEECQKVLESGGDRFKMHNPKTWAKQAKLAYEGKWQELFDWQNELDGGK